jgi:lysophospholipid acyltransferase (LPLAT)-like uncharacterized protein
MSDSGMPSNEIFELSASTRIGIGAVGRVVRRWQAMLNYEDSRLIREVLDHDESGSLILFWHNRLFPIIGAYNHVRSKDTKLYGLVSPSRDGAQLSQFLETLGVHPIRGSSSRRGGMALRELLKILEDGHHVAITVDGPRGPCYQAQPGASLLVQMTGAPIHLLGAECEDAWTINSWDRFIVPKPFSRVKIKMDRYAPPSEKSGKEGRRAIQEFIQEKLSGLTGDTHCKP